MRFHKRIVPEGDSMRTRILSMFVALGVACIATGAGDSFDNSLDTSP